MPPRLQNPCMWHCAVCQKYNLLFDDQQLLEHERRILAELEELLKKRRETLQLRTRYVVGRRLCH